MKEAAAGSVAWFAYTGVALVVTVVVIASISGARGPPAEVVFGFGVLFFSFAGMLSVPLLIARARGYRLMFPGDARRELSESDP
jgi:hypothetical protein